mmetsp:Transcript_27474/g.79204  ORF Transcript_27474/g.79204 Transcript_27474/m.79204 type:complete len:99 (+) Transcript_27474:232-528(+)
MSMSRQRHSPQSPATTVITALLVAFNLSVAASVGILQYLKVFVLALVMSLGFGHFTEKVTKLHHNGGREGGMTALSCGSCGIPGMEDASPMLAQARAA